LQSPAGIGFLGRLSEGDLTYGFGRPQRVGRYEVRGDLGGGGMGDVYRVWDPVGRRELALKVLKFDYPRALHYFKREFRAVASLAHPNLVSLYDLHYEKGRYFYTMELIDGTDLYIYVNGHNRVVTDPDRLCEPGRLERLRSSMIQLLRSLAFLHESGRIHRDIKPSNILVSNVGEVKLVDFGIVKELLPGGQGQSLSQVFGTSTYFSPEQSLGSHVTSATDVYAAGVVLYELLGGTPPFEGDSAEVAIMHRTTPPPSLVQKVPGAPPDLLRVCMELLTKEPTQRPSAREALEMLDAAPVALTPRNEFVGRRAARKKLHEAMMKVREGDGQLVIVEGAAGMGKAALLEEFSREALAVFTFAHFGGVCVRRDHVPLRGLDTLIERLAEAYRRETARILRRMPMHVRAPLIEAFTFLGELLPAEEHGESDLITPIYAGLRKLFTAVSRKRLLMLSLENVHLADPSVCDAFEALLTGGQLPPALFILTVEPESVAEGSRVASFLEFATSLRTTRRINLPPFTLPEIRRALEVQLDPAPLWLAEYINAESGGVPVFVAEMINALAALPAGSPPTLQQCISNRLDGLPELAQVVLAALCVSPKPVPARTLEHACQIDVDELYRVMSTLTGAALAELVTSNLGHPVVTATHPFISEVVRRQLSDDVILDWHARLARAHEIVDGEAHDVDFHWTAAGHPERAAMFAAQAADQARADGAHERAVDMLEIALRDEHDDVSRVEMLPELADSQARAGRYLEATQTLKELAGLAPQDGDMWRARRCQLHLMAGDLQGYLEHVDAIEASARAPIADLLVSLDPIRAEALLGETAGTFADLVRARIWCTRNSEEAFERAETLIATHSEQGDRPEPERKAAYGVAYSELLMVRGALNAAYDVVDEVFALTRHRLATHDPARARLSLVRIRCLMALGHIGSARGQSRTLLTEARSLGQPRLLTEVCLLLGHIHLIAGESKAADLLLAEALRLWPSRPAAVPSVRLALLQAWVGFFRGRWSETSAQLDEIEQSAPFRRFANHRLVVREHRMLRARIAMLDTFSRWSDDGRAPASTAVVDARDALRKTYPKPTAWLACLDALVALGASREEDAIEILTHFLEAERDQPTEVAGTAVACEFLATLQGARGLDKRQEMRRARRLLRDHGVASPPEMAALAGTQ